MVEDLDALFVRKRKFGYWGKFDGLHFFICSIIIAIHILLLNFGIFERIENFIYDAFVRHNPKKITDSSLALLEVDQSSLDALGAWPWPASYHTQLVKALETTKINSLIYAEPLNVEGTTDEINALAEALKRVKSVYLPVKLESRDKKQIWVHGMPIDLEPQGEKKKWQRSTEPLENVARRLGHMNHMPDRDGVLRRVEPILEYEGEKYSYLGLEAAYGLFARFRTVMTDQNRKCLIPWARLWNGKMEKYRVSDVVRSFQAMILGQTPIIDLKELEGKNVILGVTAPGQGDLQTTPFGHGWPAAAILAEVMNGVLRGRHIFVLPIRTNIVWMLFLGTLATHFFLNLRSAAFFSAGLAIAGIWIMVGFVLFSWAGLWLSIFYPISMILWLFIFSALYHQILAVKERSRLIDLATRDGLTGLYVIRHFREILNRVVLDSHRSKEPLAIILVDVDDFKKINDTYGHAAGDLVLKKTAEVVYKCFRVQRPVYAADFVARYGGEEFIVMLRNADAKKTAKPVAERIRQSIENTEFKWENTKISVTVSVGVASLKLDENVPDQMVRRADDALYKAKRSGKNCVVVESD